jgi:hypothetical protein
MGREKVVARTYPAGNLVWVRDATLNDSDKSFTVPANKRWNVRYIHGEITCTATVGNRSLAIIINDGTNNVLAAPKTANITASQTGVINAYSDGGIFATTAGYVPLLSAATPNVGTAASIGAMILPAGYVIRVYDFAAVDAAADDMTVVLQYEELDV